MTYSDVRPWAVSIKEEVLQRRMPPWGAVKGFGDFRNDQALTPEQMERIVSWVDGGVPEGDAKDLPPAPKFDQGPSIHRLNGEITVTGDKKLTKPFTVEGLLSDKITAPYKKDARRHLRRLIGRSRRESVYNLDVTKNLRPIALSLIVVGAITRLLPHPGNFAPVGSTSLFAGARLRGWQAYLVPLILMAVTDPIRATFYGVPWVYPIPAFSGDNLLDAPMIVCHT